MVEMKQIKAHFMNQYLWQKATVHYITGFQYKKNNRAVNKY